MPNLHQAVRELKDAWDGKPYSAKIKTGEEMKKIILSIAITVLFVNFTYARNTLLVFAAPSIMAGPATELVTKIFTEFGTSIKIKEKNIPWQRALEETKHGRLDMILTIYHTDKRAKFMNFTVPYIEVPTVVIVAKGKSFPFTKLDDLIGLRGLMVRGASLGAKYNKFASKLEMVEIAREEQIIQMLNIGRADYAIGAKYAFLVKAQKIRFEDKIEFLPIPVTSRGLSFAFSKKSSFLKYLPQVNIRIKQLQDDGTIAKMVEKAISSAASALP